jgi:branched-chain amino acid transport system permease protein
VILEYAFKIAEPLTNGISGLLIKPLTLFRYPIQDDRALAAICIGVLLPTYLCIARLRGTDLGRAFLVVRENEVVARGMGINVARTKMWAFLLSGFFAGIAGGLMGFTARLASPEAFGLSLSIDYVAMLILGGLGSLPGSLIGAAFVTLLPEAIQRLGEAFHIANSLSALREMAFGLLMIVFLIYEPRGLYALIVKMRFMRPARMRERTGAAATTSPAKTEIDWRKAK